MNNLKQIGLLLHMYANDYDGWFPSNIDSESYSTSTTSYTVSGYVVMRVDKNGNYPNVSLSLQLLTGQYDLDPANTDFEGPQYTKNYGLFICPSSQGSPSKDGHLFWNKPGMGTAYAYYATCPKSSLTYTYVVGLTNKSNLVSVLLSRNNPSISVKSPSDVAIMSDIFGVSDKPPSQSRMWAFPVGERGWANLWHRNPHTFYGANFLYLDGRAAFVASYKKGTNYWISESAAPNSIGRTGPDDAKYTLRGGDNQIGWTDSSY
ncbi:MAG: DUF1559 domain-containing protein [Candidatus Omnitrophica bacterium]|nr:DUF1559 domain-containing protein [Candidatus Omnitrophota bacterium]MCM8803422.1 DUF1559 domain-containing protein [Candidatus Omnitrophota bacterium]